MKTNANGFQRFVALMGLSFAFCGWMQGEIRGREPLPQSRQSSTPASRLLQEMTLSAGVIFVGQVLSVQRPLGLAGSSENAAAGAVEIVFHVDQALRGCSSGSNYAMREWSGLWTGPSERYSPGQRLLMFLRSPDGSGLSSTVHGAEGAIPLRGGGAAPGPDDANPDAAQWLVDLRWVQAQTPRESAPRLMPVRLPVRATDREMPEPKFYPHQRSESDLLLRNGVLPWIVAPRPSESEKMPLSQVLNLCRSFLRQADDPR